MNKLFLKKKWNLQKHALKVSWAETNAAKALKQQ